MIKRVCPLCGRVWYSAAEDENWTCDSCGHNLTPEMNEPVSSRKDEGKVRINPVAFRYFRYKSRKSVTEIAGSHHLDTFKDIWGRCSDRSLLSSRLAFRYLQGYMGTRPLFR